MPCTAMIVSRLPNVRATRGFAKTAKVSESAMIQGSDYHVGDENTPGECRKALQNMRRGRYATKWSGMQMGIRRENLPIYRRNHLS